MKKNVQKLLSLVLAVIMMISMLPFSVFAADLDAFDVEEPAVEAVSVPAEEQEIESTVEDVLVGNIETEDELLVEDAEIVEDSSEEIETVDAADPAEADADVDEEFAATETVGAGADGTGFPNSFSYNGSTYTKYGDPVGHNARFRVAGVNSSTWSYLNGRVISEGQIYYQEYRINGAYSSRIIVYEVPTTVQISQGTGFYINPNCMRFGGTVAIGEYTSGSDPTDVEFSRTKQCIVVNGGTVQTPTRGVYSILAQNRTGYCFESSEPRARSDRDPVDVLYTLYSGSQAGPVIVKTYKITYKDGVNDEDIFDDQVYTDEDAVEGHLTPHFKWPNKEIGTDGDPVRPGYRFMGWTDQDGNPYANSDAVAAVTIAGNATYTAQWAPNSITVSKEVFVGDGVEASEINHTIYIALWDRSSGYLKKANGEINYKEITVTNGVASGPVVFDENDLLESKDYTVWELAEVEGDDPPALSEIEVNGKTIHVQVQGYELNADGDTIADDNNTHLDTTNTAYIKLTNKYTSDFTSFTLNKRWYNVNGNDVTSSIEGVKATITLYKTDSDGETTEAGSIELDGIVDDNGESSAWRAEFTNLNSAYTYKAKETSCSPGYHAYQANDYAQPMGDNDYKVVSGQTIYNLPDRYGIYHSSNGTTEWFAVGEKIKLVAKVRSGYLYGGYYNYTETGDHKGDRLATYVKTGLDEDFTATENNTIYYLKEVPEAYLRTQAYVTYRKADPKVLRSMWFLTALDADGEYEGFGFIVNNKDMTEPAQSGQELVIMNANGTERETKTAYTVTSRKKEQEPTAVIVAVDASSYLTELGAGIEVKAYHITPDHVKVIGNVKRTFKSPDLTYTNIEAEAITNSDPMTAMNSEGPSRMLSARKKLTINSNPEETSYTVTKVDNGKKIAQTVKEGDNTGKITWAGKTNYVFAGWYEDASYSKAADFSNVKQDMTVYAKYVKASTVKLSFAKKTVKAGEVTLKATLKISNQPDIADTAVECTYKDNAYAVEFTGVKRSSSTDTYTGTVKIGGLENNSTFTAVISYKTPDGTIVNMSSRTCKYNAGAVTVK